jgi:hypothetical protein
MLYRNDLENTQRSQKEDGSRSICYSKRPKVSRNKGGTPHQNAAPKSSPEVATGSVPLTSTILFPGENESPRPGAHAKTHPDVRLVDEHTRSSAQHKQRKPLVAEQEPVVHCRSKEAVTTRRRHRHQNSTKTAHQDPRKLNRSTTPERHTKALHAPASSYSMK